MDANKNRKRSRSRRPTRKLNLSVRLSMAMLVAPRSPLRPDVTWFVYVLTHARARAPYVGKSRDLAHRLRQHNGEIAGGAKSTARVRAAHPDHAWTRALHLRGFVDERDALQIEWRVHKELWLARSADLRAGRTPLERALFALKRVLDRDKPTAPARAFAQYADGGVHVHLETPDAERAFLNVFGSAPHKHVASITSIVPIDLASNARAPSAPSASDVDMAMQEREKKREQAHIVDLTGDSSS